MRSVRSKVNAPFLRKALGQRCSKPLTLLKMRWWVEFGFGGEFHSHPGVGLSGCTRKAAWIRLSLEQEVTDENTKVVAASRYGSLRTQRICHITKRMSRLKEKSSHRFEYSAPLLTETPPALGT